MFIAKPTWTYEMETKIHRYFYGRDPMDYSSPGSAFHGIFQARVLEWGAIAFSKWLS